MAKYMYFDLNPSKFITICFLAKSMDCVDEYSKCTCKNYVFHGCWVEHFMNKSMPSWLIMLQSITWSFSFCSINYYEGVTGFTYFSFQIYKFLFYAFWSTIIRIINIRNVLSFDEMINLSICPILFIVIFFVNPYYFYLLNPHNSLLILHQTLNYFLERFKNKKYILFYPNSCHFCYQKRTGKTEKYLE